MIAKICSDINKPNGQAFVKSDSVEIRKFMANMEVRKIPGIGRMTELVLNNLGIKNCEDILEHSTEVAIAFKEGTAQWLVQCALGISRMFHEQQDEDEVQKSISTSETFKPIRTLEQFKLKIEELCDDLAESMNRKMVGGSHITLNMKTTKFDLMSKSLPLNSFIWTKEDLFKNALLLLEQNWPLDPMRLLGVKMS